MMNKLSRKNTLSRKNKLTRKNKLSRKNKLTRKNKLIKGINKKIILRGGVKRVKIRGHKGDIGTPFSNYEKELKNTAKNIEDEERKEIKEQKKDKSSYNIDKKSNFYYIHNIDIYNTDSTNVSNKIEFEWDIKYYRKQKPKYNVLPCVEEINPLINPDGDTAVCIFHDKFAILINNKLYKFKKQCGDWVNLGTDDNDTRWMNMDQIYNINGSLQHNFNKEKTNSELDNRHLTPLKNFYEHHKSLVTLDSHLIYTKYKKTITTKKIIEPNVKVTMYKLNEYYNIDKQHGFYYIHDIDIYNTDSENNIDNTDNTDSENNNNKIKFDWDIKYYRFSDFELTCKPNYTDEHPAEQDKYFLCYSTRKQNEPTVCISLEKSAILINNKLYKFTNCGHKWVKLKSDDNDTRWMHLEQQQSLFNLLYTKLQYSILYRNTPEVDFWTKHTPKKREPILDPRYTPFISTAAEAERARVAALKLITEPRDESNNNDFNV
jgi:hypothetical protein